MRLVIKKPTIEQSAILVFCLVFSLNMIMFTFNNLMRIAIGRTFYLDVVFVYACYIIVFISALPRLIYSMKLKYWIILIVAISLPIISCSNSEVTNKIVSEIIPFCVIAFMAGVSIRDFSKTWDYLQVFAWAMLFMCICDTFLIKVFEEASHMLGYSALFSAVVFVVSIIFEKKKRVYNIIGLFLCTILAIQSDTAGALAAMVLTAIVAIIYRMKEMKKGTGIFALFILTIIAVVLKNTVTIAEFILRRFGGGSINMRMLEEIAGTGITTDRYRDSIYEYCFQYAKEHWFWGTGVGNDRLLISANTLVRHQDMLGNYPHNIFLEFLVQYGMICGLVISIILLLFLFTYFIREKEQDAQKIAVFLLGMGFFPLLYSSTYIENSYFYLLIAFVWSRRKQIILSAANEDKNYFAEKEGTQ